MKILRWAILLFLPALACAKPPTLYPCTGTSMQPLIWEGDWVLVWDDPWPPRANQLVAFKFFSKLVSHRVVVGKYGQLMTAGDNEFRRDGVPLMRGSYVGMIHGIISKHYHGVIVFNQDDTIPDQPYPLVTSDAAFALLPTDALRRVRLIPRPATTGFSPPRRFLPPSRPRS